MLERTLDFVQQAFQAGPYVWTIAIVLSLVCGYLVQTYIDDVLHSFTVSVVLFSSGMLTNEFFAQAGLFVTESQEANAAAAVGAAMCTMTLLVVVGLRLWIAVKAHLIALNDAH